MNDAFMIHTIGEKDKYKQSFLLMGYFRENKIEHEIFLKKFGLYLLMIKKVKDQWVLLFYFRGADDQMHLWTSESLKFDGDMCLEDMCREIAYIENYGFHTLNTGKLIGFD